MIATLRSAAGIAVLVLGLFGGGSLMGAAAWFYNEWIDNPHVRELERVKQESACTIRTQDAANRAREAEAARQQQATDAALDAYRAAAEARDRLRQSLQDKLEQEIADYEAQLAAEGRACLLDDPDLRWLRGAP